MKMGRVNSFESSSEDQYSFSDDVMEHTLERPLPLKLQAHYQPPDQANFWMFAMIGMGCAFVVFVIGSIYLMCKSQPNSQPTPIRRHPTATSKTRLERLARRDML